MKKPVVRQRKQRPVSRTSDLILDEEFGPGPEVMTPAILALMRQHLPRKRTEPNAEESASMDRLKAMDKLRDRLMKAVLQEHIKEKKKWPPMVDRFGTPIQVGKR